ncbi:hypothetical protein V5F76_02560 [Xanthobacter agilis]|uniref:hypothetical protein n=1 Tax=Xanthobacter agilis TaxID=47492 RepID=UPI00372BF5AB
MSTSMLMDTSMARTRIPMRTAPPTAIPTTTTTTITTMTRAAMRMSTALRATITMQ